jgi:hypothetical protein
MPRIARRAIHKSKPIKLNPGSLCSFEKRFDLRRIGTCNRRRDQWHCQPGLVKSTCVSRQLVGDVLRKNLAVRPDRAVHTIQSRLGSECGGFGKTEFEWLVRFAKGNDWNSVS